MVLSGKEESAEFKDFEFTSINFFGFVTWLVIVGISESDTLMISTFLEMIDEDEPIILSDSVLIIVGSFGSGQFAVVNVDTLGLLSGSLTFSSIDTSKSIAGSFADGSSLMGISSSDSTTFKAAISGGFTASKGEVTPFTARLHDRIIEKNLPIRNQGLYEVN